MEYQSLGKTGLFISKLSYGTWETFSTKFAMPEAKDLMAQAYEAGVNFFDNAETYADGKSEELMGQALKELGWDRSSYIISSKVFWGGSRPTQMGLSRKHVVEACHKALKRLNLDYLDLFYCHRPDKDTPVLETVRAMDTLIKQGKILYWGTSEWEPEQIMEAMYQAEKNNLTPPSVEQPQYNMFERQRIEKDYVNLIENYGLGTTTWSPLCSGILTGKYKDGVPKMSRLSLEHLAWLKDHFLDEGKDMLGKANELEKVAEELGTNLTKMSIAWCISNPNVSSVILGASNKRQLDENLQALDIADKITPDVKEKIDQILGNRPAGPQDFKEF